MKNLLKNKRILITSGPTWVPIDDVRVISNTSTGVLGQTLAKTLQKKGAKVTLLEGPVPKPLGKGPVKVERFTYYRDLKKTLLHLLKKYPYDIIVHAAAVSDYEMDKPVKHKIPSDKKSLTLKLVKTEKLITRIKRLQPLSYLVGFKLEPRWNQAKIKKETAALFEDTGCDLVVANSSSPKGYKGFLVNKKGRVLAKADSRTELVGRLTSTLQTMDM